MLFQKFDIYYDIAEQHSNYCHCPITAREVILIRCNQVEPLPFLECYPDSTPECYLKIGESTHGEVFILTTTYNSVIKIIPIEGSQIVNGKRQQTFDEILCKIIIQDELNNLRNNPINNTCSFSEVKNIRCIRGRYPQRFLHLWDLYYKNSLSQRDSPVMFNDDQLYIVQELVHGGVNLNIFPLLYAGQAHNLFFQTAAALAIAEASLQFEHRNLHWRKILFKAISSDKVLNFRLNGYGFTIPNCGVQASLINFSLSRITFGNKLVKVFHDLSSETDLFTANGDYQFEVYKIMQRSNGNDWSGYNPHSNVLWLYFLLNKIINHDKYSNPRSYVHHLTIMQLKAMKSRILNFNSATNFVINEFLSKGF